MKKNKVVLVNPGVHFHKPIHHGVYPNTGLMVIATILHNAGFNVKIVDGRYLTPDESIKAISEEIDESLIFVGFSTMTIQVPWSYHVSKAIKSLSPKTFIVWGGVHASLFPEQTVEDTAVDMAVINDSASTIAEVARKIATDSDLSTTPGICYNNNSHVVKTEPNSRIDDFNSIPFIDLSLLEHKRYARKNCYAIEEFYGDKFKDTLTYPIITGLGCCYKCTFCINVIQKKRYYFRQAPEMIERIKLLQKDYGANFIHLTDEDFLISKKRTFELLDLMEKQNLHFWWRPQARADHFSDNYINVETARRLEKAGLIVAAMGVESGSQRILDKLKKNLKVEQIIKAAEILSKTDSIVTKMNFMVGLPTETEEEMEQTFQLAMRLRKIAKRSYITVIPFRPYPGSELYDELVSGYGYKPPTSLNEWSRLTERELIDSQGYESFESYNWVKNMNRLKSMIYVYDKIAWFRPRLYRRIRSGIAILRLRFDFFAFIGFEKRFFEVLAKIKYNIKELLFKIKVAK